MKFKPLMFILILVLTFTVVFAQTTSEIIPDTDFGRGTSQVRDEIQIPQGKNATTFLPMFSKTYIRIYEGSKLDFHIVDPEGEGILVRNSFIVKEVKPTSVDLLLSTDNSEYNPVTLPGGKEFKINYSYSFVPNITLTPLILHYDEDPEERNVMIYFFSPHIKSTKTDFSQVKPPVIDINKVATGNVVRAVNTKYGSGLMLVVLIALFIGICLLIYKISKK